VLRNDIVGVVPAYQCEATIEAVVTGLCARLGTVVVVDDGSRDRTAERALAAGAVVERHDGNRGKGAALRTGIDRAMQAAPAAIALLDADGQHDPEDLPGLLAEWDLGRADLVIGTRLGDAAEIPRARYWTNYIGSRILTWMTGRELEDSQSGYRVVGADLLRRLALRSDGYAIETEMLIKAAHGGARIAHVPVRTIYGGAGSHFQPVRDTFRISCAAIYFKVFASD